MNEQAKHEWMQIIFKTSKPTQPGRLESHNLSETISVPINDHNHAVPSFHETIARPFSVLLSLFLQ